MMPPGMQVAMQTAANLTSPRFAKLRMDTAPKTDAEILLNETAGKGSGQLTVREKVAKNLDLNSKDEDRMILTNIVSEANNISKDQSKNDLINSLNDIKLQLNQQIKEIDHIIKSFDK